MKRGRKTNLHKKISKLILQGGEDRDIGLTLLLSKMDSIHPDEFQKLNNKWSWESNYWLGPSDIQKYLYDKRQSEQQSLRENRETSKEQT